jgi:hypothetical protein
LSPLIIEIAIDGDDVTQTWRLAFQSLKFSQILLSLYKRILRLIILIFSPTNTNHQDAEIQTQ